MPKLLIYYHRSYRKISGSRRWFVVQFLLTTLPLFLGILWTYPLTTRWMCRFARSLLSASPGPNGVEIIQRTFLLKTKAVFLLIVPGAYPSHITALVSFFVLLVMAVVLQRVKKNKHIAIFTFFLVIIHTVSSLFFLLAPHLFPYTVTDFAELYVKTTVCIWMFIPLIMAMSLLPLPAPFIFKYMLIWVTLLYSFVFATLRYAVFLYVLSKFSFMYMALLYFALGPLIDFFYVVCIYSLYATRLAKRLKNKESVWRWLY